MKNTKSLLLITLALGFVFSSCRKKVRRQDYPYEVTRPNGKEMPPPPTNSSVIPPSGQSQTPGAPQAGEGYQPSEQEQKESVFLPPPRTADEARRENQGPQDGAPSERRGPLGPVAESGSLEHLSTGYEISDSLFYVDAAADSLMADQRAIMEDPSVEEFYRQKNARLAERIQEADLRFIDGEVRMVLKMTESPEGRSRGLQAIAAGPIPIGSEPSLLTGETPFGESIEAQLYCVDSSEQAERCRTHRVRMAIGNTQGERAISRIVFRNTAGTLFTNYPNNSYENGNVYRGTNRNYSTLRNYLKAAEQGNSVNERFNSIQFKSFAVVTGQSGYQIYLATADAQYIGFKGPLIASRAEASDPVMASVFGGGESRRRDPLLYEGIDKADLIRINDSGSIALRVMVRGDGGSGQGEELIFNFGRK